MTDHLTEEEVLAAIPLLTRTRLVVFIETGMVIPVRQETEETSAHVFRRVDFARLRLLCDLADALDLHDDALGVVVTLIDQLHATRADLLAIVRAVETEPPDIRARIGLAVLQSRG